MHILIIIYVHGNNAMLYKNQSLKEKSLLWISINIKKNTHSTKEVETYTYLLHKKMQYKNQKFQIIFFIFVYNFDLKLKAKTDMGFRPIRGLVF